MARPVRPYFRASKKVTFSLWPGLCSRTFVFCFGENGISFGLVSDVVLVTSRPHVISHKVLRVEHCFGIVFKLRPRAFWRIFKQCSTLNTVWDMTWERMNLGQDDTYAIFSGVNEKWVSTLGIVVSCVAVLASICFAAFLRFFKNRFPAICNIEYYNWFIRYVL